MIDDELREWELIVSTVEKRFKWTETESLSGDVAFERVLAFAAECVRTTLQAEESKRRSLRDWLLE